MNLDQYHAYTEVGRKARNDVLGTKEMYIVRHENGMKYFFELDHLYPFHPNLVIKATSAINGIPILLVHNDIPMKIWDETGA